MRKMTAVVVGTLLVFSSAGLAIAGGLKANLSLPPPEGFKTISPCIPFMGFHYADPKTLPLGPILGYSEEGKLLFIEYMMHQSDFKAGKSWDELAGLHNKHIDHFDIHFLPKGHHGYEVPHYDIHAYVVSHVEHMKVCPPKK